MCVNIQKSCKIKLMFVFNAWNIYYRYMFSADKSRNGIIFKKISITTDKKSIQVRSLVIIIYIYY